MPLAENQGWTSTASRPALTAGSESAKAFLLERPNREDEHTAQLAVVGERSREDQLPVRRHLANVRHVRLLQPLSLARDGWRPLGPAAQEDNVVGRHLVAGYRLLRGRGSGRGRE